ncbi:TcaA NTF2-like domain-containing protein [Staphylococcus shinii]|uniref:TcaA NTF2-like domain-containing protein n=1 Tax=Staphylococcus shinii TaxID=2912228 RepID=UPI003EECFD93
MNSEDKNDMKRANEDNPKRRYKKPLILLSILLVICIIIGLVIYIILNTQDSKAQVKDLKEAVDNREYSSISNMLSTNERNITEEESKNFVDYVNKGKNKAQFDKQINHIIKELDNQNTHDFDLGEIKDRNNRTYIKIHKNGKKLFFINKIKFEPVLYSVYVKEGNNTANYKFQNSNDKRTEVTAHKNRVTKLGNFFIGSYRIGANKSFKQDESLVEGDVDGSLEINTDKLNKDNKIIATDNFDQLWFKVKLKNDAKVKNVEDIYINGNKAKYEANKVYGKFPAESNVEVYSEGKIDDKTFKTKNVNVDKNEGNDPQVIELAFDQKEIDKYINKKNKFKNKAKDFMKDYTKKLNKAYEKSNYEHIRMFFDDQSSDLAKHMKKQVNGKKKSKYSEPKFEEVKTDGNKVDVILNKSDKNHNTIRSRYELIFDDKVDRFKIKEYTDI